MAAEWGPGPKPPKWDDWNPTQRGRWLGLDLATRRAKHEKWGTVPAKPAPATPEAPTKVAPAQPKSPAKPAPAAPRSPDGLGRQRPDAVRPRVGAEPAVPR